MNIFLILWKEVVGKNIRNLKSMLVNSRLRWLRYYGFGFLGCILITFLASIPVSGMIFFPALDGPDHWAMVQVIIETIKGQNPGWELVFIPAYKLFYLINAPLFFFSGLVGFTPKAFPSLSISLLQFIFSVLVGLKLIHALDLYSEKRKALSYILGISLSLFLTLFASLSLYSGAFYWGFIPFLFSVPFAVVTIMVFEECIIVLNKSNLFLLFCLLFLSYTAHPYSLIFLTIWVLIRMLVFYILEFAKGSKITLISFKPFASFFTIVLILATLHHISLPKVAGIDFYKLAKALLDPFHPPHVVYGYLEAMFLRAYGFTPGTAFKPEFYSLTGLILILGSLLLNFCFGGWRNRNFQTCITAILFLIVIASFVDDIIPSHYPFGVYFRDRLITIVFPIVFTLVGYSLISNREIIRKWIIVVPILIIVGFGSLYHIRTLSLDFSRFDMISREIYREMMSRPNMTHMEIDDIYHRNGFRYWVGYHFSKYACIHEGICRDKLFHETYPDFGIFPLKPKKEIR